MIIGDGIIPSASAVARRRVESKFDGFSKTDQAFEGQEKLVGRGSKLGGTRSSRLGYRAISGDLYRRISAGFSAASS